MLLLLFLKNTTTLTFYVIKVINFIKFLIKIGIKIDIKKVLRNLDIQTLFNKKNIKKIIIFVLYFLFLNLYLFPTTALCEIDPNLLDRENNMYNGSKIVDETPDTIITERDLQDLNEVILAVIAAIVFVAIVAVCESHINSLDLDD
jgi:hypothetical protein